MGQILVEREVRRFLESPGPEVLCIRGKWGTGKTHAWKAYLMSAVNKGSIKLKRYSYVSLFGLDSLSDLKAAIVENTVFGDRIDAPPSLETFKNAVADLETAARKGWKFIEKLPFVRQFADSLPLMMFLSVRSQIVCLDDLERKGPKLTINDVLGLMSLLKEQRSCKVVIILNDEQLDGVDEFEQYLEKVVDRSLLFQPSAHECGDLVLDSRDDAERLLLSYVVALDITNIRVISRIKALSISIEGAFCNKDRRVFAEAIKTLAVLSWSYYDPKNAPTIPFLRNRTRNLVGGLLRKKEVDNDEQRWHKMLDAIQFNDLDKLGEALLTGIKNGVFDQRGLDELAASVEESLRAADLKAAFHAAWRLYHDSLDDNEDLLVANIEQSFRAAVPLINMMDLDGTVALLKRLGYADRAVGLISFYFDEISPDADAFERRVGDPFNRATDEDVIAALGRKQESLLDNRSVKAVLEDVAKQNWGDLNIARLAAAPPHVLATALKAFGPDYKDAIDGCLLLDQVSKERGRDVVRNIREAIKILAEESKLNSDRLQKYLP